jgi:hypothetical protein
MEYNTSYYWLSEKVPYFTIISLIHIGREDGARITEGVLEDRSIGEVLEGAV